VSRNLVDESMDDVYVVEDTIRNKFLLFKVGHEEFGIEISCVKEIINMVSITQVPSTPDYVKGIINLRGDIIPIINVRTRFRMEEKEYDDLTCIIVIEFNSDSIGLIVDEVSEVKYIKESNISQPPSAKLTYANQFVKNLGRTDDRVVLLIEANKLLYDE
jgi:purine-binding chemotaxis protein CheW